MGIVARTSGFGQSLSAVLFLFTATALLTRGASAQASPTASRSIGISAFAGFSEGRTDYNKGGAGFIVGGDVMRGFRGWEPAIELRYGYQNGNIVTEDTFQGGLKLGKALGPGRRFHPYGEVAAGYGTINYKYPIIFASGPYTHDNSAVYSLGGGANFDVTSRFSVKGDFQYQHWSLGSETGALTPSQVSVGVVYRVPAFLRRGPR